MGRPVEAASIADGFCSMDSWTFALKLCAEPGVSEACLKLQDEENVDVMLMLGAAFAASQRNVHLDATDIGSMDHAVRPWREQVVSPLRSLRRRLKVGPSAAPSEASERLRALIKANELDAEHIENDILSAWLESKSSGQTALTTAEVRVIVTLVVRHALGHGPAD